MFLLIVSPHVMTEHLMCEVVHLEFRQLLRPSTVNPWTPSTLISNILNNAMLKFESTTKLSPSTGVSDYMVLAKVLAMSLLAVVSENRGCLGSVVVHSCILIGQMRPGGYLGPASPVIQSIAGLQNWIPGIMGVYLNLFGLSNQA